MGVYAEDDRRVGVAQAGRDHVHRYPVVQFKRWGDRVLHLRYRVRR